MLVLLFGDYCGEGGGGEGGEEEDGGEEEVGEEDEDEVRVERGMWRWGG